MIRAVSLRAMIFLVVAACVLAPRALGMTVDGRLNELEWQSAQRFDQLPVMEPLSGAIAEHASTMRVLAPPV